MGILNLKKTKKSAEKKVQKTDSQKKETAISVKNDKPVQIFTNKSKISNKVILRPHFTEKSYDLNTKNVYVFEVAQGASKSEITKEIKAIYGVTPKKVNVLKVRAKILSLRGRKGKTASSRKAYVYLKAGEKIDLA